MKNKQIFILIGPKGSGKTFIGTLFNKYFKITFVRVEEWVIKIKNGRDIDDEEYIKDAFTTIEQGVRNALNVTDSLVFESTGLTEYFNKMLSNLQLDHTISTIKINADLDICLNRIKIRDQLIHINISDEEIEKINTLVVSKNFDTDYLIENSNKSVDELNAEIKRILKSTCPNLLAD